MTPPSPTLIALTGGIGTGKSVVSRLLRTMGYDVYDCDAAAKRLMADDAALRGALADAFGADTYRPDGSLDRARLAACIFGDAEALARMNALVHPAVRRDLLDWRLRHTVAGSTEAGHPLFYESAILHESGFHRLADAVWCISAPLDLRVRRAALRDGTSPERIRERIASQMPQEEKERRSDRVILNDARHSVIAQVRSLLASLPSAQPLRPEGPRSELGYTDGGRCIQQIPIDTPTTDNVSSESR